MRIAQALEASDLNNKLVADKHKELQMQSSLAVTHKDGLKMAMQKIGTLCDSRNWWQQGTIERDWVGGFACRGRRQALDLDLACECKSARKNEWQKHASGTDTD